MVKKEFLFLLKINRFKPATASVTSDLPLGSGLGSSASFCVAVSAAVTAFTDPVTPNSDPQQWVSLEESRLELINKWAFEGEKIIHGKPSGIDNTISTYGNVIKFKAGELSRIQSSFNVEMLITNTRVGRNTKALVGQVAMRMARHDEAMASVFDAVDAISRKLVDVLQSLELSRAKKEEEIGELMEMNQGLLRCMGVSHPSIEAVLRTTEKGRLSSKLTGAGGGGCVLTLMPSSLSGTVRERMMEELEALGYQCLVSRIGGNGVEVCFG